jgi:hypothetical protein
MSYQQKTTLFRIIGGFYILMGLDFLIIAANRDHHPPAAVLVVEPQPAPAPVAPAEAEQPEAV